MVLLGGCNERFKIQEVKWSGTGEYLSVLANQKIYFLSATPPYIKESIEIDTIESSTLSWSPIANKVVYSVKNPKNVWDLEQFDLNNQSKQKITNDLAKDFLPRYLNSEEILFYTDRTGDVLPWVYMISSAQFSPLQDKAPELLPLGLSSDDRNEIKVSPFKKGSLISGIYKDKKWKWKEPILKLHSPKWAPDNKRCLFIAENEDIFKGEFLYILDFENKEALWVPILPEHYLVFSDVYSKQGEWETALDFDQQLIKKYPNHPQVHLAYQNQINYYLHQNVNLSKAKELLLALSVIPTANQSAEPPYLWLGVIYAIEGAFDQAQESFQIVLKNEEDKQIVSQVNNFSVLIKEKSTEDLSYFFRGFVFAYEKKYDQAISSYKYLLQSLEKSESRFIVLEFLAEALLANNQTKQSIQILDEVVEESTNLVLKEKARLKIAESLEKERETALAFKAYLKVKPPYQEEALQKLFYMLRDDAYEFKQAVTIGDFYLKKYPGSKKWNEIYAELNQIRQWFYEGVSNEEIASFYLAQKYKEAKENHLAVKEYEKALKQTENRLFKQTIYQNLSELHYDSEKKPVFTLAALFSYYGLFDSVSFNPEEWDERLVGSLQKALQEKKTSDVIGLCQAYLKEYSRGGFDLFVYMALTLASFSEKDWKKSEESVAHYFEENKKNQYESADSFLLLVAAMSAVQQEEWDRALSYYNKPYKEEYAEIARSHSNWIQLFRLSSPKELKQFLLADLKLHSEFSLLEEDKKSSFEVIDLLAKQSGELQPLALLKKIDWLVERDLRDDNEKRIELYQWFKQIRANYSQTEWDAQAWLKIVQFERDASFFLVAKKSLENFIETFKQPQLQDQARFYLAQLYLNQLESGSEAEALFKQNQSSPENSEWKRKAILELAQMEGENSEALYKQLVQETPYSEEAEKALIALGLMAFDAGELKEAEVYFNELKRFDLSEDDLGLVTQRLILLKAGKKAVKLWKQVQVDLDNDRWHKLGKKFKKLVSLSDDLPYQILICDLWVESIRDSKQWGQFPNALGQRIKSPMSEADWGRVFDWHDQYVDETSWFSFVDQALSLKGLPKPVQNRLILMKAKEWIKQGKVIQAKHLLSGLLKRKELHPDILKTYFSTLKKLSAS